MFGIGKGAVDLVRASARAGVRPSAVHEIRAIATRLADQAVPAFHPFDLWKSRLPAPHLLPIGTADAARAADDLRGLVRWVDDGDCLARGAIGAERINELLRGAVTGSDDARRAAVAVVNTSKRQTGWTFHAATAFRSAEDDGVKIVDHLLGARVGNASGVFSIDDWARHIGRHSSDVRLQSSVDNIPYGGSVTVPATRSNLRGYGERLVRSIMRADS